MYSYKRTEAERTHYVITKTLDTFFRPLDKSKPGYLYMEKAALRAHDSDSWYNTSAEMVVSTGNETTEMHEFTGPSFSVQIVFGWRMTGNRSWLPTTDFIETFAPRREGPRRTGSSIAVVAAGLTVRLCLQKK